MFGYISNQRHQIVYTAAKLEVLDGNRTPLICATGFIRKEGEDYFLYTCWHCVAGYKPFDLKVGGNELPKRRYIKISTQGVKNAPGAVVIGGLSEITLPLYNSDEAPLNPRWLQEDTHVPNFFLNNIGIYVPFFHDVVKLKLPSESVQTSYQVIDENLLFNSSKVGVVELGDKCIVVGYPDGFSAAGDEQPTPVGLTRFIAATRRGKRSTEVLLESIAGQGMSGGPVFIERGGNILLFGMYTGSAFTKARLASDQSESMSDLGVVSDLSLLLFGDIPMVQVPSQPCPKS